MPQESLSLYELNQEIKNLIKTHTQKRYWVTGEISELKINSSGHCYLELIQKDEITESIIARCRATIWAQTLRLVKAYFETTTGQMLTSGLSIMVKVSVEYHEVYGLSLNIHDIEPSFTVGEMALQKQKIIAKLSEDGVLEMNRELILPMLCQKIAVISSATAAGFGDFSDQLSTNPYGLVFYTKLFPAIMQGETAEKSIIDALDRIYTYEDFFDAVVIIRGGGSQADLNCFNAYWLAYHITQFPLPVLTGIGHEQDDTVVDLVAHTRLKTPTAVAAFLVDHLLVQEEAINELASGIQEYTMDFLDDKQSELESISYRFQLAVKNKVHKNQQKIQSSGNRLAEKTRSMLQLNSNKLEQNQYRLKSGALHQTQDQLRNISEKTRLLKLQLQYRFKETSRQHQRFEELVRMLDPKQVLKRGYSITLHEGKVLQDSSNIKEGEKLTSILYKGSIESEVLNKKK